MICDTSHALRELFTHAKNTLSTDKLEWLGGLDEHAEIEADNIAATLQTLGGLLASDNKTARQSDYALAKILWGLATQAGNVAALVHISAEAKYLENEQKASQGDSVQGGAS